jgi:hypothetical protein
MAYEERLADRLRGLLAAEEGIGEKKMFGGLAFLLDGNMALAASGRGGLLARVDPGEAEELLARERVEMMEMGGRRMRGWLTVAPQGIEGEDQLATWVTRSVAYARTLPPKPT